MVDSKLFIFGGQVDGKFLNDMWALDLNTCTLDRPSPLLRLLTRYFRSTIKSRLGLV